MKFLVFLLTAFLSFSALAQTPPTICSDTATPTCHNKWQGYAIRQLDCMGGALGCPFFDMNGWQTSVRTWCEQNWLSTTGRQLFQNILDTEQCPVLYDRIKSTSALPGLHPMSSLFWAYATFEQTGGGQIFAQFLRDKCGVGPDSLYCCLKTAPNSAGVPSGVITDPFNQFHPLGAVYAEMLQRGCFTNPAYASYDMDNDDLFNALDFSPYHAHQLTETYRVVGAVAGTTRDRLDSNSAQSIPGISDWAECGDCNLDGQYTVSDLVCINQTIFGGPLPADNAKNDANGDGSVNVSDIVAVNVRIFDPTALTKCSANQFCPSSATTCGQ